jgi:hypothetical protein
VKRELAISDAAVFAAGMRRLTALEPEEIRTAGGARLSSLANGPPKTRPC